MASTVILQKDPESHAPAPPNLVMPAVKDELLARHASAARVQRFCSVAPDSQRHRLQPKHTIRVDCGDLRPSHLGVVFSSTNVLIVEMSPGELTEKRIPRPSAYGLASENIFLIAAGSELAIARS